MRNGRQVRITPKRKSAYLDSVNAIRPLTNSQIEWCRKDTSRYIRFIDKDALHGHCERCGNDVEFKTKTKHHSKVTCPKCRQKMEIRHNWRVSGTYYTDFRAIVKAIDKDKLIIRYVQIVHVDNDVRFYEVARELCDFEINRRSEFECENGKWVMGNKQKWFTETYMWNYRKDCCLQANPYIPGLKAELKKMDMFKYIDDATEYFSDRWYVTAEIRELGRKSNIYEKLEKVGLTQLAKEDFNGTCGWYGYSSFFDTEQTSLVKMLKLNKANYRRLFKWSSIKALVLMQRYPNIKNELLDCVIRTGIDMYDFDRIMSMKLGHEIKTINYLKENNLRIYEYEHYVGLLKELGYKLDKAYLFPKDFRKEDQRIADEYQAKKNAERLAKMTKQSALIKEISDGLREMPDLQEFLNGSKGLLVYVPESAKELVDEGKALHNCIGTYVDRIAEGKTLVFFVRQLNAPDAPFVAFEYVNGEVVQCRYDHNENVEDDKIINFVDAFAERLRKNKVLYKAA